MSPHIHIGFIDLLIGFLGVLLLGTAWRLAATKYADKPIGQAMAFMY